MSFYNKYKNPFPFYTLEGSVWTNTKTKWHRNNCSGCCYLHKVFVGTHYFQLPIDNSLAGVSEINSVDLRLVSNNSVVAGTTSQLQIYVDSEDKKYLVIAMQITAPMIGDLLYVSVDTEQSNYYSEIFCVSPSQTKGVSIEWSSSSGKVGSMVYQDLFKHSVYLDAVMVQSEPEIEETTVEDGFGLETPTLQVLKQGYELSVVVPNFIAQALSALPLHDKLNFINRAIGETSEELEVVNKYVTVKATPEADGCNSFVEITFVHELIIETACNDAIVALNNPPVADIVWDDTGTTESRNCGTDETCTVTLRSTNLTSDPDGNLDTLEWQRSDDQGDNWTSLGSGDTKEVTESVIGKYWYRLVATDVYGLQGISNVLVYKIYNAAAPQTPVITEIGTVGALCGEITGVGKPFDINAASEQSVKIQLKVTEYFGAGFELKIIDRNTSDVLHTWTGGPVNTTTNVMVVLDSEGLGEFSLQLCLNDCVATAYTTAEVLVTLFDTDGITLTDQTIEIGKYHTC